MEWITSILGMISGGWGTFASLLLGLVTLFVLYKKYTKYKQDKAHEATKDKEAKDQAKDIKDNQSDSAQAKKDEATVKDLDKKALEELNKS